MVKQLLDHTWQASQDSMPHAWMHAGHPVLCGARNTPNVFHAHACCMKEGLVLQLYG
jgi:hypothetical protein